MRNVAHKRVGPVVTVLQNGPMRSFSLRDRRIAEQLAMGEKTSAVANRFELSCGRISQLRRELHDSWHRFHREEVPHQEPDEVGHEVRM